MLTQTRCTDFLTLELQPLLTNVPEDNADEEEVDDLDDDNWNDEEEGSNARFRVGDRVCFTQNERQMAGVIEDVINENVYGVRANRGRYYSLEFITNSMRLFDVDNEELPPEPTERPFRAGDLVAVMNSNDNVGDIRVTNDIGVITYAPVIDGNLGVRLLRTGEIYSFRRTDIAYLENVRSYILVGDIVTHNVDYSNDV